MRSVLTKLLFFLISLNVAYGTQGDFFAEQAYAWLRGMDGSFADYTDSLNNDYFVSARKGAVKAFV